MSNIFYSGLKVRQIRMEKAISARELAKKSGLSVSGIHRIESGTTPRNHTAYKLAKGLEVDVKELIEYEDEEKNSL